MSDERAEYLASGQGDLPADHERLDLIRELLASEATWSEPPPEVGEGLMAAIGGGAGAEPATVGGKSSPWRRPLAAAVATAALVAVVLGLFGAMGDGEETTVALRGTELEADAWGEAVVGPTDSGWWIRLDLEGLPAAPEGTYYEGWVWSDDGEGVSIGTFHLRDGDEPVTLWSGVDPADYPAIWVTLEDEDGDPSASDRIVMVGRPDDA